MSAEHEHEHEHEHDLVVTRVIDAPPALAFATWTNPALLTEWWGPHSMTTPEVEMDLRPGGVFRTLMRAPDGAEYPTGGVFLDVEAPRRIVFTEAFRPGWVPSDRPFMTAVITFEEQDGKTLYTGRARHWTAADAKEHAEMGFHEGWGESADRFAALVMRRKAEFSVADAPGLPPRGIVPHVNVEGASEASAFYRRAFGATELFRLPAEDGERLMHCHLKINGGDFMMCDCFPEFGHELQRSHSYTMHLHVEDVNAWWRRAVEAGCEIVMPLDVQFWGDRYGQVRDPFGVTWSLAAPAAKG